MPEKRKRVGDLECVIDCLPSLQPFSLSLSLSPPLSLLSLLLSLDYQLLLSSSMIIAGSLSWLCHSEP